MFIAALLVVWLWNRHTASGEVQLELSESSLTVSVREDFSRTVDFDRIGAVALAESGTDLGEMADGTMTKRAWYGAWRNTAWGEYTLAVSPAIDTYLVITTVTGETLVINYEEEETTRALYEAIAGACSGN